MNLKIINVTEKRIFIIMSFLAAVMFITFQCDNMCTKQYVIINIILQNRDGQPVILDSCQLLWVSKNQKLVTREPIWPGHYVIVDDMMQQELENKRETIHFTGYLNDEIVYETDVLVGADNCHVKYLGKDPIIRVID